MNHADQEKFDRIEARLLRIECENTALIFELLDLHSYVRHLKKTLPEIDPLEEPHERFLSERKKMLQKRLEWLEESDPARAARLLSLIEGSSVHYPIDYD